MQSLRDSSKQSKKPPMTERTMAHVVWERYKEIRPGPLWVPQSPMPIIVEHYLSHFNHMRPLFDKIREKLPKDWSFGHLNTLIGMEIELENSSGVGNFPVPSPWTTKGDGSLRNGGIELISAAHRPEEFPESLALVLTWLHAGCRPDFSWRTSVHVHMDCSNMKVEDFKKLIILYFLFENSLFQFANPGRRDTNIFCAPLTRVDFYSIRSFLNASAGNEKDGLFDLTRTIQKYSALNLAHMFDFGTLEFRHLRGTSNIEQLLTWVGLILKLREAAERLSLTELNTQILSLNTTSSYDEFTEAVFGDYKPMLVSPLTQRFLSEGVSLTKELLSKKQNFKLSDKSGLSKFMQLKIQQTTPDRLLNKLKTLSL